MKTATTLGLATLVIGLAAPAAAQRGGGQPACKIDSSAAWYRKQREWLDESKRTWTNDSLRSVLLAATGLDPKNVSVQTGVFVTGRDSRPTPSAALADVVASFRKAGRGGMPTTRSAIGPAGTRAFYLLALADSTYRNSAMHRLMEAGPDESFAADVAVLEDMSRLAAGRKQIYGTQFRLDESGKVVLAPMEDSTHADLRREGAGLPPFMLGICIAHR